MSVMHVLIGKATDGYLFNGVVLAAGAAPVRALIVQNVQCRLPLFEFQGLNFCLELVELLLKVLALLHVLHSAAKVHSIRAWTTLRRGQGAW